MELLVILSALVALAVLAPIAGRDSRVDPRAGGRPTWGEWLAGPHEATYD
jgi:hypothetical protein